MGGSYGGHVSSHPHDRPLSTVLASAALLGAATGLRSQMGLAALVWRFDRNRLPGLLRSRAARPVTAAAALVELGADQYPGAPPRTAPTGLIARITFGALTGGLAGGRRAAGPGAGVGAVLAVVAAFGGMAARSRLSRRFPPVAVALAEDAVAVGLALVGCMTLPSE